MKLVVISFLYSIFTICAANGPGIECPDQFASIDNGCYHLSTNRTTWFDALVQCRRMNALLVSIETVKEYYAIKIYLMTKMAKDPNKRYWTSGTDAFQEGQFKWMSTLEPFTYDRWCHDDPHNRYGTEKCVYLDYRWLSGIKWCLNDVSCNVGNLVDEYKMPYICESKPL